MSASGAALPFATVATGMRRQAAPRVPGLGVSGCFGSGMMLLLYLLGPSGSRQSRCSSPLVYALGASMVAAVLMNVYRDKWRKEPKDADACDHRSAE